MPCSSVAWRTQITAIPLFLHLQHLPVGIDLHVQSQFDVQQVLVVFQLAVHLASHVQQLLLLLTQFLLTNLPLPVKSPLQLLKAAFQHHFLTGGGNNKTNVISKNGPFANITQTSWNNKDRHKLQILIIQCSTNNIKQYQTGKSAGCKECQLNKNRGKRVGIRAKTTQLGPKAIILPSLLLANVQSLENNIYEIRLRLSQQLEIRDVPTSLQRTGFTTTSRIKLLHLEADRVSCQQNTRLC